MNRQQDDGCLVKETRPYAEAYKLDEISIQKLVLWLVSEVVMPRKEFGATTICFLVHRLMLVVPRLRMAAGKHSLDQRLQNRVLH
jgi:hypothetical protein